MTPIDVPVIDLALYDGTAAERAELALRVDEACRTVGFFEIEGHGIPQTLIDAMLDITADFFDLPLDDKMPYVTPPEANRGFSPRGSEALSYSAGVETPPDMFEAFNAGAQIHSVDPSSRPAHHASLYHENVWPAQPGDMRSVWEDYMAAVAPLAQRVLRTLALGLGIDVDFFADQAGDSPDVVRALNYHGIPIDADLAEGQMSLGAHSDYGTCTILYSDPVPGLQILDVELNWREVTPTPGRFLVNLGDMMAAWTNDRWRSTLHRVVPLLGNDVRRRSMAYFHEANPDAMVAPLEVCIDDEKPARYEPISAGDHLRNKLASPRSMKKADAVQTSADRLSAFAGPRQPPEEDRT